MEKHYNSDTPIRHCAIITVYKDIDTLNRMLSRMPKDWGIYIHIDKKSDLLPSDIQRKCNVISKQFKIYWGSINHLNSILYLLKQAYTDLYDYYHIITGQDFPISKKGDLTINLDNKIYIQHFKLPVKNWWGDGLDILRYTTCSKYFDVRKFPGNVVNKLLQLTQKYFGLTHNLPDYPIYAGLVYCSLPHYAVDFTLNSKISQDLLKRIRYSTPPEEIFFQTVLMNSPYVDNIVNNNLRYCEFDKKGQPKILDISDYHKILSSKAIFMRKIDAGSDTLIDKLDSTL